MKAVSPTNATHIPGRRRITTGVWVGSTRVGGHRRSFWTNQPIDFCSCQKDEDKTWHGPPMSVIQSHFWMANCIISVFNNKFVIISDTLKWNTLHFYSFQVNQGWERSAEKAEKLRNSFRSPKSSFLSLLKHYRFSKYLHLFRYLASGTYIITR